MEPEFYISTDKSLLDTDLITDFLSNHSYWAKGRSKEKIRHSISNSLCFGLYTRDNKQVGFARIVSDYAVFAWLMDVFVLENYRGKGLGKMLMEEVLACKELQEVVRWGLGTQDAHSLYEKFGFRKLTYPERMMELVR